MNDLIEKNAQVKYNKEFGCLEVKFIGYIPYNQMVKALEYEYAMINHYKLKSCLVDLREIGVYAPGVADLIKNEWFKKVMAAGVTNVAFVVPQDLFGEASMNNAHKGTKNGASNVKIAYSQDPSKAREWISSQIVLT